MRNELGIYTTEVVDRSQFVDAYLEILNSKKKPNQENPLVLYVKRINRFNRVQDPLVNAVVASEKTRSFVRIFEIMNFDSEIEEIVKRPLDQADDFEVNHYYWRKKTIEESLTMPFDTIRHKLKGEKKTLEGAQKLAGFYLGQALELYAKDSNFTHMAIADVFHSRGQSYLLKVINTSWKIYATKNNLNSDGYFYPLPDEKRTETSEHKLFYDQPISIIFLLNIIAGNAWLDKAKVFELPRDVNLANTIGADRNDYAMLWDRNLPKLSLDEAKSLLISKFEVYL